VFTLAGPQAARIAKTQMNRLLGHDLGFTWQRNLLITDEDSRKLADATKLTLAVSNRKGLRITHRERPVPRSRACMARSGASAGG